MKMRASRSRLGPQTQARLAAIEARLQEQLALALSQRAAGKRPEAVRALLTLAISVLR